MAKIGLRDIVSSGDRVAVMGLCRGPARTRTSARWRRSSRRPTICYRVFGTGPAVVLLHGHPIWGGRWVDRSYVAGLQDRFRVIVPDRSGTATAISHTTRTPTATPDIAADVLAVPDREAPRLQ